jgi:hypothetical protein
MEVPGVKSRDASAMITAGAMRPTTTITLLRTVSSSLWGKEMDASVREKGLWFGSTSWNPYPMRAMPLQNNVNFRVGLSE